MNKINDFKECSFDSLKEPFDNEFSDDETNFEDYKDNFEFEQKEMLWKNIMKIFMSILKQLIILIIL